MRTVPNRGKPMRISCPSCMAAYEVPDALIGSAPRQLRCARCGVAWTVHPEAAETAEAVLPGPIAMPEPPAGPAPGSTPGSAHRPDPGMSAHGPAGPGFRPEPRMPLAGASGDDDPFPNYRGTPALRGGRGAGAAWLLSVLLIVAGLAVGYVWRTAIVAAWPPSGWIYLALGLR